MVRQETIEISEQRTAFVWFFAQEVDWCMINCDKQRLQTSVSINLWKILAGHTGDWFDVKTASICTTELWDALKSFILTSLKFKVAPYPIIVSLDTLKGLIVFVQGCWAGLHFDRFRLQFFSVTFVTSSTRHVGTQGTQAGRAQVCEKTGFRPWQKNVDREPERERRPAQDGCERDQTCPVYCFHHSLSKNQYRKSHV